MSIWGDEDRYMWSPDSWAMECPKCSRKGSVHRVPERRIMVRHTCPGPFLLEGVEPTVIWAGTFRVTFYGLAPDDFDRLGISARDATP